MPGAATNRVAATSAPPSPELPAASPTGPFEWWQPRRTPPMTTCTGRRRPHRGLQAGRSGSSSPTAPVAARGRGLFEHRFRRPRRCACMVPRRSRSETRPGRRRPNRRRSRRRRRPPFHQPGARKSQPRGLSGGPQERTNPTCSMLAEPQAPSGLRRLPPGPADHGLDCAGANAKAARTTGGVTVRRGTGADVFVGYRSGPRTRSRRAPGCTVPSFPGAQRGGFQGPRAVRARNTIIRARDRVFGCRGRPTRASSPAPVPERPFDGRACARLFRPSIGAKATSCATSPALRQNVGLRLLSRCPVPAIPQAAPQSRLTVDRIRPLCVSACVGG